jgi:DNA repair exonuclease SbcCD ATPase subunit
MEHKVLLQLHDELLKEQPSGAVHDTAACPLCSLELADDSLQGGEMTKQYSQEELDTAIRDALQGVQSELETLKASQQQSDIDARIATVTAEFEGRINELQAELDSAVLKATEADRTHQEFVAALEAMQAEQEAAAEIARRRDDRLATVREVASFPDEYTEANADRWAALDDAAFEALVSDWKAISAAKRENESGSMIPAATAMVASRQDNGSSKSVLAEVLEWNLRGIDPKKM